MCHGHSECAQWKSNEDQYAEAGLVVHLQQERQTKIQRAGKVGEHKNQVARNVSLELTAEGQGTFHKNRVNINLGDIKECRT